MKKRRGRTDGQGNRSGRDKRGTVFWIDRAGRRTSYNAPQKPRQPRDEYGRVESRQPKPAGERPTRLPPYRVDGKFARHPLKDAADRLHKGVISSADFLSMAEDDDLSDREIWDIYDQVYG